HQEHRARRRDQLRLWHRLLQGLPEADRLQMRRLREKAQEAARRGAGGKTAPEGEGGAEGFQESREAGGEGREEAERQDERRGGERQPVERPRREIPGEPNDFGEIRNFRESPRQAARREPPF